ncbi:flagellar hook-length control protein FliK [Chromobacterium sp. IIBBL 290-4]|uniref:flagellar hook-length control protein FliK n=1 Tax=Chromobacterium sp. IIBBL 290-4 TaxID=2953890 RepID=UPI0020B81CAE|nr:flagellar hook-length control protein FliK [Chromobacterium sp. IIBBL 290-4]UTH76717.1 flagellar hook-length control protein FliK [Chromobacterium sp. IIBBL 290-4]
MIPSLSNTLSNLTQGSAVNLPRGNIDASQLLEALTQPGKLPSLMVGELLTAKIADQLGNNQLAVLIKNGLFTLSLPPGVNPSGDSLNLKVVSLQPSLTFALQQGGKEAAPPQDGSVAVKLSTASRYLTSLLSAADDGAPAKPLQLDAAEHPPAQLAKQLQQNVKQSGLFYESHLKDFSNGLHTLEQLKQEPQAKFSLTQQALDIGQKHDQGQAQALRPQAQELGSLVQRQLDGLENRAVQFQGLAWPGQPMQLQIEQEKPQNERQGSGQEDIPVWNTSLSLELPALGGLGVRVRMIGQTVQVSFQADEDGIGAMIKQHAQKLQSGMEAAGLTLASLVVNRNEPAAE